MAGLPALEGLDTIRACASLVPNDIESRGGRVVALARVPETGNPLRVESTARKTPVSIRGIELAARLA